MKRTRRMLWIMAAACGAMLTGPRTLAVSQEDVAVTISVVVVDDLVPRPVPLTDVLLVREGGADAVSCRTTEEGMITLTLSPGTYRIRSPRPLAFKGRSYTWDRTFVVEAGGPVTLKLTDADAQVATAGPKREIGGEAALFERVKSGVATIEGGSGHGSGFIVDSRGLILTNQHVTQRANLSAVRFGPGMRYAATIVEEDESADVAVMLVNPQILAGRAVLTVADGSAGPVAAVGERVLAIGSPLNQEGIMTIGIVSKVADGAIISDVNINPGNSGGPLLNMAGEVIGINSFADLGRGTPGLAGIVAIEKAVRVLERARAKMSTLPVPSAEPLPDVSPTPIPVEALRSAAMTKMMDPPLIRAPRNFETILYTPFYRASREGAYEREISKEMDRRAARRQEKGDPTGFRFSPRAFWNRYAMPEEPVVWVVVRPALKEKWLSSLTRIVTRGLTKAEGEFRDDFYDMVIERDGTEVQAVRRFRLRSDAWYDSTYATVKDAAYGGLYAFDPRVFAPGTPIVLKVRKATDLSKWHEVKIGKREQERIWAEFAPWRALMEAQRK